MHGDKHFIKTAVPSSMIQGADLPPELHFAIDSRQVNPGDIFVALPGLKTNGHAFITDAVKRGAAGLMIEHDKQECLRLLDAEQSRKLSIIIVPATYDALIAFARAWRAQFSYPVVGITGSVGKTTTKEYLATIFRAHNMVCLASHGTQNTALGCALTLLRMRSQHDVAIFEMGVSKQGEMIVMADLVRPTTAVITSIGHSHLEGLGSLYDVATEKRAIFYHFNHDNIGIIHGDQTTLAHVSYKHPSIRFGSKTTNQIQARKIRAEGSSISFMLKIYNERYSVTLPTNHTGRVMNVLAATAVAHHLGVPHQTIITAIMQPLIIESRFQQKKLMGNGILIDDCYNASPESMKAALLAFEQIDMRGRKIAVLGDMLELGVNTPFWHRQLGRLLRKVPSLSHVLFVGQHVQWAQKTIPLNLSYEIVPTWQDATEKLKQQLNKDSIVLVKGSHGMGLKYLIQSLV